LPHAQTTSDRELLEIGDELKLEMGDSVFDDLLLLESTSNEDAAPAAEIVSTYQVLVECADEKQQQELIHGFMCAHIRWATNDSGNGAAAKRL
jgi:hypothetical protein